jgi:AcrR family transcriptional regulator
LSPVIGHPAATTGARARARRGEGELLREQILDAAEQLLVASGDEDAVSIRAIADAVGVTPPSIYLHFADKETLLFSVCDRQFEVFDQVLTTAAAGTDPVDRLRRRSKAYVQFGIEHPEAYRIMFMGRPMQIDRHVGTVEKAGTRAFNNLVDDVQRGIESGALRDDVDAVQTSIFLWSGMHGITSLFISLGMFDFGDRDALVDTMCSLQLRAITAPAGVA